MATRKAHARWEGSIKEGKGQVDIGNGAFKGAYSFASRFEDGKGTNPEELLGAAHAGCFAMALSLMLGNAGFKPDYVDATAHVTVSPHGGGFKITKSSPGLRGEGARHRRRRLCQARRGRESGLPGVAGARRHHDYPRCQARLELTALPGVKLAAALGAKASAIR